MHKTKTIQYLVDEKGRKTSVLMSYKTYRQLMEDLLADPIRSPD